MRVESPPPRAPPAPFSLGGGRSRRCNALYIRLTPPDPAAVPNPHIKLHSTMPQVQRRGRPGCSHRLVQHRLPWLLFIGIIHVGPAIAGSRLLDLPPPPPGGPASSESAVFAGGVGWSCMRDTRNGQVDATHTNGMVMSVVLRPHSPAAMAV